jgi:hypothetical protein
MLAPMVVTITTTSCSAWLATADDTPT